MSAGNKSSASSSHGGGQRRSQSSRQQVPVTRDNLSQLPYTPNIDTYRNQDSSYERRILGQPTQFAQSSTAVQSLQNFDAQFNGAGPSGGSAQ